MRVIQREILEDIVEEYNSCLLSKEPLITCEEMAEILEAEII